MTKRDYIKPGIHKGFFSITDTRLSERVHPGPVREWEGTPWEWHERYMLYLDGLEFERVLESYAAIAQTYEEIAPLIARLIAIHNLSPQQGQSFNRQKGIRSDGNETQLIN